MSQNHETLDSDDTIVIAGYTGLFRSTTFARRELYPSRRRDVQTLSCYDQANANGNPVMSRYAVSFKANYLEIKQNAMKIHHFWMISKSTCPTFFVFRVGY